MSRATLYCSLLSLLAAVFCFGDGNIHFLENEIADAIKSCTLPLNEDLNDSTRHKRAGRYGHDDSYRDSPKIDSQRHNNKYGHERRDSNDMQEKTIKYVINSTLYPALNYSYPQNQSSSAYGYDKNYTNDSNRQKRQLLEREDDYQCLSQCVFTNLQVVDSKGIPREAELWNVIQKAVTSQQLKITLKDQIQACFQEMQTESEDNGCSYSNKLERCLMLRLADRKHNGKEEYAKQIK